MYHPGSHLGPEPHDVIVVGFGPVGATLACLLALRGLRVLVLEATDCSKTSPRAINMDDESMRLLVHQLGLGESWTKTTAPFPGGNFVSGYPSPVWLGIGVLSDDQENPLFGPRETAKGRSGFPDVVFYQPELERQLHARVSSLPNVTVEFNTRVVGFVEDGGGVEVRAVRGKTSWVRTEGGEWLAERVAPPGQQQPEEAVYSSRFLVACDGAKSTFRRLFSEAPSDGALSAREGSLLRRGSMRDNVGLGLEVADRANGRIFACDDDASDVVRKQEDKLVFAHYDERWLVVDVGLTASGESKIGATLPFVAQQICDPSRPATIVPGSYVWDRAVEGAPRRHYRWEFLLGRDEDPVALVADDAVYGLLGRYGGREDFEIVRAAVYNARGMDAIFWESPRGYAFLCGDAAHTTPPFLGQGLNQGLRDANNIAWKLEHVLLGKASPSILGTYMAEQRPIATYMTLGACDVGRKLQRLAEAAQRGKDALESLVAKVSDAANPHTYGHVGGKWGAPMMPRMESWLISRANPECCYCGLALYQEEVRLEQGREAALLDTFLGIGFSLIIESDGLSPCSEEGLRRFQGDISGCVVRLPSALNGGRDKCMGGIFETHVGILVRPDRIVFGAARHGVNGELDRMIVELRDALRFGDHRALHDE